MRKIPGRILSEVRVFRSARNRCINPNVKSYPRYGGRGIQFLLSSYEEMIEAIGHKPTLHHTLDRIDNNKNYEVGNIRWATPKEQAANRNPRKSGFKKGPYLGKPEYERHTKLKWRRRENGGK